MTLEGGSFDPHDPPGSAPENAIKVLATISHVHSLWIAAMGIFGWAVKKVQHYYFKMTAYSR